MDWKFGISSFVFIGVTILKLIFPEQSAELRRQAVALIDMDMDYQRAIMAIGAIATEDSVQQVIGEMDTAIEQINQQADEIMEWPVTEEKLQLNEVRTETEIPLEVLSKVEAFYQSQEAYSDFETPSNVSYEQLDIPFSYGSPVTAVRSSGFGYRIHPIEGQVMFHYGTDYDVSEGTELLSFADGFVSALGEEPGYGKYICIDHGDGWESLYAHCSELFLSSGQSVKKGDVLGLSGSTGRVTGPHLHFELRCNDLYTNPEFFLP